LTVQLRGDSLFVGDNDTFEPGLYELRFTPPPTQGVIAPDPVFYSVNLDRGELDPTPLATADFDWLKQHGYLKEVLTEETLPKALGAQQGGTEVWWLLGVLLLAFLLLEVWMTRNLAKQQGTNAVNEAGLGGMMAASAAGGAT
jgi:hypothetical protein